MSESPRTSTSKSCGVRGGVLCGCGYPKTHHRSIIVMISLDILAFAVVAVVISKKMHPPYNIFFSPYIFSSFISFLYETCPSHEDIHFKPPQPPQNINNKSNNLISKVGYGRKIVAVVAIFNHRSTTATTAKVVEGVK